MENSFKDITPPAEFSGEAQLLLYTRYGDPRETGWDNKWIADWHIHQQFSWFPQPTIRIHKHYIPILTKAFKELEAAGLHIEIKTCDCCFAIRHIKGSDAVLSVHSWGAALDLNAQNNPLGSVGSWSNDFIEIMKKNDICCGQLWSGRKDPMHFSMING